MNRYAARFIILLGIAMLAVIIFWNYEGPKLGNGSGGTKNTPPNTQALKGTKPNHHIGIVLEDTAYIFPQNFMWGVATSAFQYEGGDGRTDWDAWKPYTRSKPFHPGFTEHDIALASELGIKYIRISIEWARAETTEGHFDDSYIREKIELIHNLRKYGVEPFVNLNHFTLPSWVAHKGGWTNDSIAIWFGAYTKRIAKTFKPLHIKWWITFNEPTVILSEGYINGNYPPNKKNALGNIKLVSLYLIKAHKKAYDILHATLDEPRKKIMVGIANYDPFLMPNNPNDEKDTLVAGFLDLTGPHAFIIAIEDRLDYLGINYYGRDFIKYSIWGAFRGHSVEFQKPYAIPEDRETQIDPEGLREAIRRYQIYGKPLIITENGINDEKDKYRPRYLVKHLISAWNAMQEIKATHGVPVLGYFYWTLLDSYEWSFLKTSHLGLIAVNQKDSTRSIRPSALLYRDIIRANGITKDMLKQYQ